MKTALRLFSVVLAILTFPLLAAAQLETIDTTARGTGRQLGHTVSIKLIITRYSTAEDRQTLVNAFKQGQQRGLVNALQSMQSAGRIQIPGTVGFDLAYVEVVPTPTGRRVRFITNRRIAFAEAAWNTRSRAFDQSPRKLTEAGGRNGGSDLRGRAFSGDVPGSRYGFDLARIDRVQVGHTSPPSSRV